ncbi:undecaprenyl-diphosphate phosphatase, partial [Salmonella enterica]|nr:undecaprenyl-diphosphate phosphatase [Salmonella enterica]
MNNIENFDTVFTTFPLFYIGMIVAGLSYITFAVMMNFIKRGQFLKKVLEGKYDLPGNDDNELEVWKKEPFLSSVKLDRKHCIIQS